MSDCFVTGPDSQVFAGGHYVTFLMQSTLQLNLITAFYADQRANHRSNEYVLMRIPKLSVKIRQIAAFKQ